MSITRVSLFAAASLNALISAAPALAQDEARPSDPWAQAASDILPDPAVRFGVLPNGMQYAILHNATPPGQASLRLRIDAGSLMETEEQLGLAHFMEHMAFNGTTNIPENELLRILERRGLAFGADTNAFTAFDQTVYQLDLPRADADTVETSLKIMREQVSEALLAGDAVDAERGVIEGEERLRNTPSLRLFKAQMALLAPRQRVTERLPIGDLRVIRTAPRDRFVEFYNAYYRPSRATLIAVGDVDVDEMELRIRAAFESWRPRGADGPEPDLGRVAPSGATTAVFVEPGAPSSIELNWISQPTRSPDSVAQRRDRLLRGIGLSILNRRLGELARSDDPPFIGAGAAYETFADSFDLSSISAQFEPAAWSRALQAIEQEQRRMMEFGVGEDELRRELTLRRTALENAVAARATRRSPDLANRLVDRVNSRSVFTAPETDLSQYEAAAEAITPGQVNEAFRLAFAGYGPLTLLSSPVAIPGGEAAVEEALGQSRTAPVAPPVVREVVAWPYTDFGVPSAVLAVQEMPEVGATSVTFRNGVRLIVKPTAFRDEQVLVAVRTGIGDRGLPRDKPSPLTLAPGVFAAGGLGRLGIDEIQLALTGHVYSTELQISSTSFALVGETRPDDLATQMQVLAAYLTDPGVRPGAFAQLKAMYANLYNQSVAIPAGAFTFKGKKLLTGGDRRETYPTPEELAAFTNEDLKFGIVNSLAAGPIDVVVVGDVSVEAVIAAIAPTFGALPARGPDPSFPSGNDQMKFPDPTAVPVRLEHAGPADQGFGYVAWPTTDQISDHREARRVDLLSKVFELRVLAEIRERQALAYSPGVEAVASDAYPGYGFLSVAAELAVDKLPAFYAAVDAVAESLREAPPSEDELERARRPLLEFIAREQVSNEYWIGALSDIAERPDQRDQVLNYAQDFEAMTPADVQATAQRYLRADRAWRASVLPAAAD